MNPITFAQIESTSRCNLSCTFCVGREFSQTHLNKQTLHNFFSLFPTIYRVHFQGEGEPFLNPDWGTLLSICKKNSSYISTTSNGTTLTETHIDRLIDSNLDSLKLSLETSDPAKFESIRGFSWSHWLKNVTRLVNRIKERQSTLSVGFMVTLLKSTYLDIPKIVDLYKELSCSGGIEFQWINQSKFFMDFYRRTRKNLLLEIPTSSDISSWNKLKSSLKLPIPIEKSFYQQLFSIPSTTCPWLDVGIFMDRTGRLSPCCMIKPEHYSIGTVQESTLTELNKENQKLKILFTSNIQESPCFDCPFAKSKLKMI